MPAQLGHETLAKAHHFVIALALRIKVRSSFASAHRQSRERILEYLLESEKLQDARIDCRMESQATLVWAKRAVEFKPEPAIDVNVALIILPWHPEHNLPFRFHNPVKDSCFYIFRMLIENGS